MTEPRHAVLDVVVVRGGDAAQRGRRGVVTEIRRYTDGRYVYGLGAMTDGEDGGLYPDDWLEATGERSQLERFRGSGTFKIRDVVRIRPNGPEPIRGKLGQVVAEPDKSNDPSANAYAVLVEDAEEVWMVAVEALESTGRRAPTPGPGGKSSLRVSVTGEVLGHDSYDVIDQVEWHL